jgi:putative intracellular protease/amidase
MFDGVDVLDFAGPLEIFSHASFSEASGHGPPVFKNVDFTAQSEIIPTSSQLRVIRDLSIDDATGKVDMYDVLLVPGGPPDAMTPRWKSNSPELEFRPTLWQQASITRDGTNIIFSACTGLLLVARAGFFANISATSHHTFLDDLREPVGLAKLLAQQTLLAHVISIAVQEFVVSEL